MSATVARLIAILRETRDLIARPGADSFHSDWRTQADALDEFDKMIAALAAENMPHWRDLGVLFAGAGPVQDWSMDNGWGQHFLQVAVRFGAAIVDVYPETAGG